MSRWFESHFTGFLPLFIQVPLRAHDPQVCITAGELAAWFPEEPQLGCSGAGWTAEAANLACLGEGIERCLARAIPGDGSVLTSWNNWGLDEPPVAPDRWILFHRLQYEDEGFPFVPLTPATECRWVCCREAVTGAPRWVPEDLVYLTSRPGEPQKLVHGLSTGLTCGRGQDDVLLRGAQEVIERDALLGGWWGRYAVEEWPWESIRQVLGDELSHRVERPNLTYRGYHIRSPFSHHVTMISASGLDAEGLIFSVGTACRETRVSSWEKSLLEAIQGRHCVRQLMGERRPVSDVEPARPLIPRTFFEHALVYTVHPERLSATVLESAGPPTPDPGLDVVDGLSTLRNRLGVQHPILFRNLTPPERALDGRGWLALRVLIPGLQPLHGDHLLPFLGGPLWQPRSCSEWESLPPHPFA